MSDADSPILPPPAAWIIRPNELEVDEDARPGGRVAQGRWRSSLVIVKVISKQAEPSMVYERGELWTSLRHPNILQIFGMSPLDADPLYVVTSFQPNGNVTRFLHQNPHVDRTRIVLDVVLGMQYLHANQLVHGSLKPTNILVANDGKACISDCGMIEVQTSGSNGHRYFSPEAWKGTLSRPSDVFAWAMCALEIFGGQPPWGILSEKQIFRLVVREDCRPDRPDEDNGLTDHIWGLMEECWHRESRLRPTFDILAQLLQNAPRHLQPTNSSSSIPQLQVVVEPDYDQPSSGQHLLPPEHSLSPADALVSVHSRRAHYALSMQTQATGPPAYEVVLPTASHPGSAPPALSQFRPMSIVPPAKRPRDGFFQTPPRPPYVQEASDASSSSASPYDSFDEEGMSPMMNSLTLRSPETPMTPWSPERRLAPSPSVRTSSSGESPLTFTSLLIEPIRRLLRHAELAKLALRAPIQAHRPDRRRVVLRRPAQPADASPAWAWVLQRQSAADAARVPVSVAPVEYQHFPVRI
ncbi:kinase-like domain-containing protein [Mycena sp. CBHHK59/15]|nr:kinase-like domain-containing protein [Mycena sp. CBHHK59/15]